MFSADAINKAMEQNKEEQKKLKQKLLPRGFNILELESVKLEKSKNNDPMFVITVKKADDKAEEFRSTSEYLVIQENGLTTKEGINLNVYTILLFFANAFKYTLKEPDADDPYGDIEKQLKQFEGKRFRGIIAHKMELNQQGTKAFAKASVIFKRCVDISDTSINENNVDANQYFTDLSPRDKAILRGDAPAPAGKAADVHGVPEIHDEDVDKLPF